MKNSYNTSPPYIMYIDLNSCFATVEQQARPMLRGRPVAVVNRRTEHAVIITASYEAKRTGVTLGMRFKDAKRLCPELIGVESDPPKYRYVYRKLMGIMSSYSAYVRMNSIDEGVIDFSESTKALQRRSLQEIGREVKRRLIDEVGCMMRCNVGIGTNRFLAKTAANLNKPDGLDAVTSHNIREVFSKLKLKDLTGIADRMKKRLNAVGIFTPLEFLDADAEVLEKIVFKSINGREWHQRLRGWEVDKRDFPLRSVGRQYVLEEYQLSHEEVTRRLHHLCEQVGYRMRSKNCYARGVAVHVRTYQQGNWSARCMSPLPFFSDKAIFRIASELFLNAPSGIKMIAVTCYELSPSGIDGAQLSLFGDELARERAITNAVDEINERYGTRTITSADTLATNTLMSAKISFGSTRYL